MLPADLQKLAKTTSAGRVILTPEIETATAEKFLQAVEPFQRAGKLGVLLSAGSVAQSGAALVVDDVAGETNQDRSQGGVPCPEGGLPDGGSGGTTRVVPGHPGGN